MFPNPPGELSESGRRRGLRRLFRATSKDASCVNNADLPRKKSLPFYAKRKCVAASKNSF